MATEWTFLSPEGDFRVTSLNVELSDSKNGGTTQVSLVPSSGVGNW